MNSSFCATVSAAHGSRRRHVRVDSCDSIASRDVSGASVYVLSEHGASNEAARWLADRENAADLMGA